MHYASLVLVDGGDMFEAGLQRPNGLLMGTLSLHGPCNGSCEDAGKGAIATKSRSLDRADRG